MRALSCWFVPSKMGPRTAIPIAIVSVSFASIFIKWSEAPSLVIAFYRLAFATMILLVPTLAFQGRDLIQLSRKEVLTLTLVGLALAFHFGFWISSLKFTSVANSVILVSTHPIPIALISHRWLGEKTKRTAAVGIAVALFGMALIGVSDAALSTESLIGDILALVGMAALAAYLLSGRRIRKKIPILPYAFVVYLAATAFLLLGCLAFATPLYPYPQQEWVLFLALAVIPMIFGHTLYNWALRYVAALLVSASILAEPILSSILAYFLLSEVPSFFVILGGPIVLAGIFLVVFGRGD
ncbi:MAG: DMT family transporter [Thermoplasmata archaeon]|nr:DMT family transporter [Thermoplasmata archaeon]